MQARFLRPLMLTSIGFLSAPVLASDEPAVAKVNFSANLGVSINPTIADFAGAGIGVRLPLGHDTGMSFSVKGAKTFAKKQGFIESQHYSGALSFFKRNVDVGQFGLGVSNSVSERDGLESAHSTAVGLFGSLYYEDVTLSGQFSHSFNTDDQFKNSKDTSAAKAGINWFLRDNLNLTSRLAYRLDAHDHAYNLALGMVLQPHFFHNKASFSIGYNAPTDDFFNDENQFFHVGLQYYFGTNVSLKDRQRRY